MRIYFFDVTLKVDRDGRPVETVSRKAARAASEHLARRSVVCHYLADGFQVLRLVCVNERARGGRSDG
jgi:hypothetical protein